MPSICSATRRPCEPWESGRAPCAAKNSAPQRSFRFTKTFTERCWRKRRRRHQFFWIRQDRQAQPDQRPATFPPIDHHFCGIAVEHLQALGNIRSEEHTSELQSL